MATGDLWSQKNLRKYFGWRHITNATKSAIFAWPTRTPSWLALQIYLKNNDVTHLEPS